jgi:protocatechuate 3,4-dioxygenase, alpha subunit
VIFRRPPGGTHPPNDTAGYRSTAFRHPKEPLIIIPHTLSEITGPAYPYGRIEATDNDLTVQHAGEPLGERIIVQGRVLDEDDRPIPNTLVEIWQANAAGRYNHPLDRQEDKPLDASFRGWGRTGSDFSTGIYTFETIKPGPVIGRKGKGTMAPHINFWIVARGINIGLNTRMYFGDENDANARDPVLNIIEQESRRNTLIAPREMREGSAVYTFDIYLQGERETVFFDV